MNGLIQFLNTDLVLTSAEDLTALASSLDAAGLFPLQVALGDDGFWYAAFETSADYDEPDTNIAAMLTCVETLAPELKLVWSRCTLREFNIGYDCGKEPWAFNQGLSTEVLRRMAEVGATLRITLYPDRDGENDQQRVG